MQVGARSHQENLVISRTVSTYNLGHLMEMVVNKEQNKRRGEEGQGVVICSTVVYHATDFEKLKNSKKKAQNITNL